MKRIHPSILAPAFLVLAACSFAPSSRNPETPVASSSSSSLSSEQALPLTYEGRLEKADVTAAQGTHRLSMGVGLYLALESSALQLDDYLGEEVKVTGYVRTALNGKDKIMDVSQIISVLSSLTGSSSDSSSSVSSSSSSVSSSLSSVASSSSAPYVAPLASSRSSTPPPSSSSVASSVASAVPPPPSSSSSSAPVEPVSSASVSADAVLALAKAMAKMDLSPAQWTQKYCTSYVGFCFPMHKNWYFKSFGAKASSLWHVELSSKEIENIGEAPLVIDFVSGALPAGAQDASVLAEGDMVRGYRMWTGNRHFLIAAPAVLRTAVEYIVQEIATYEPPMSP